MGHRVSTQPHAFNRDMIPPNVLGQEAVDKMKLVSVLAPHCGPILTRSRKSRSADPGAESETWATGPRPEVTVIHDEADWQPVLQVKTTYQRGTSPICGTAIWDSNLLLRRTHTSLATSDRTLPKPARC
jgi:hypothetical protein